MLAAGLVFACVLVVPATAAALTTSAATVSSAPCVLSTPSGSCQSTDPEILADSISDGDTSACTFDFRYDWGDGTTDDLTVKGHPTGSQFLTSHTYASPGTYTERETTTLVSGPCGVFNQTFSITIVAGGPTTAQEGAADNLTMNPTTCSSAQPVNCATGTFWHSFIDVRVPGLGLPLQFIRTYSSAAASTSGPLGNGWTDSYNMRLSFDGSGNPTLSQENGSTVSFYLNAGLYFPAAGVLAGFVANANGTYTFARDATNDQYVFNKAGQLLSESDRNGYTTTLSYDAGGDLTKVTDQAGRSLTLTYSGGHLVSMTDPMGNTTSYAYDSAGELTSTTDPLGRTWRFTYDSSHRLLAMTDLNAGTTTNTYDSSGRVTEQVDPLGRTTEWSYSGDPTSSAGGSTTITDPRGTQTTEQYSNLELTSITGGAGTPQAATTSYTYDLATLGRAKITDPDGNVTTKTYDGRGDLLTTTDPLGNVARYTYDSKGDRLTATDPLGTTTTYTYDGNGNLLSESTPLSGGGAATWSYTYGSGTTAGDVLTSTNSDGKTSTYTYDTAGDPTSITDPFGNKTTATYDSDGRALTRTTPNGHTTTNAYDADGELTRTTDPLGQSTSYSYDQDGNQTSITDASGHTTTYAHDADNEQTQVTQPDGSTASTAHDADGNVLSQTDGNGHATTYTYDPLDRVATTTDPDGHKTTDTYDGDGNLLSSVDPSGRTTTYTYDADDRITGIAYSDGTTPNVTEGYDADGDRTSMSDGTGTSSFTYDSLGNLTSETNGAGATISYAHDPAGNVTSITYPNGQTVDRAYDGDSDLTSVTDWLGHTTSFGYDGDRNLTSEDLPGSVTSTSTYDAADRLTGITDQNSSGPLASFNDTRDAIGQLTGSTTSGSVSQTDSYSYDANNRLTGDNGATYGYDAGNNPTTYVNGQSQTFDPANELLSSTTSSSSGGGTGGGSGGGTGGGTGGGSGGSAGSGGSGGGSAPSGGSGSSSGATTAKVTVAATASAHKIGTHRTLATRLNSAQAGDLLLAFVSAQGPKNARQTATTPKSSGLKWGLVTSGSSRGGIVSVWQTHTSRKLTGEAVTTQLGLPSSQAQLTVIAIDPGATLGPHANRAGKTGAPSLALSAPLGAQVWAVGHDADSGARLVPLNGSQLAEQVRSPMQHAASWVQDATITNAGLMTVGERARSSNSWSLAAVIVKPGVINAHRAELSADNSGTERLRSNHARALLSTDDGGTERTFTYNADGDRTDVSANGTTTSLGYDQADRLTSISGGISYSYDGDGLRTSKTVGGTTTQFAWDESETLPLLLQDGSTYYIDGPGGEPIEQITGSTPTHLLADQQGSTRLLTDNSGTVVGTYSYDPWGNLTSHTGTATTNLQYDGQYTDPETGYQYLRARYYDPTTGQFIGVDPALAITGQPYTYAGDDPLNAVDRSGDCSTDPNSNTTNQSEFLAQYPSGSSAASAGLGLLGLGLGTASLAVDAPILGVGGLVADVESGSLGDWSTSTETSVGAHTVALGTSALELPVAASAAGAVGVAASLLDAPANFQTVSLYETNAIIESIRQTEVQHYEAVSGADSTPIDETQFWLDLGQ